MFAICVESSHEKGMGHFFKMLNFVEYLNERKEEFIILINEDNISNEILSEKRLPFCVVDFAADFGGTGHSLCVPA
jgi:spore coat polysaccharide biosynthesis predicted glycosyltransferase SpsG